MWVGKSDDGRRASRLNRKVFNGTSMELARFLQFILIYTNKFENMEDMEDDTRGGKGRARQ